MKKKKAERQKEEKVAEERKREKKSSKIVTGILFFSLLEFGVYRLRSQNNWFFFHILIRFHLKNILCAPYLSPIHTRGSGRHM